MSFLSFLWVLWTLQRIIWHGFHFIQRQISIITILTDYLYTSFQAELTCNKSNVLGFTLANFEKSTHIILHPVIPPSAKSIPYQFWYIHTFDIVLVSISLTTQPPMHKLAKFSNYSIPYKKLFSKCTSYRAMWKKSQDVHLYVNCHFHM